MQNPRRNTALYISCRGSSSIHGEAAFPLCFGLVLLVVFHNMQHSHPFGDLFRQILLGFSLGSKHMFIRSA